MALGAFLGDGSVKAPSTLLEIQNHFSSERYALLKPDYTQRIWGLASR